MKKLLLFLAFWGLMHPQHLVAQMLAQIPCTPPGLSFTEGFNSSNPCTVGGTNGCNYTWAVGSGTGGSITTSPITGSGWCKNSLKMVQTSGTANYWYTGLPTQIPSGATGDLWFRLEVTSESFSTYSQVNVISVSSSTAGNSNQMFYVELQEQGSGTFYVYAGASTTSSAVAISLSTSYVIHVHVTPGSGSSYLSVNGGANQTFTVNANAATFMTVGNGGGSTPAATYYIGAIYMSFPGYPNCANSTYPWAFVNWNGLASGSAPTVAGDAASTVGGAGTWTQTAGVSQMTYQSGTWTALHTPIDVCGQWQTGSGNQALRYSTGTAGQYLNYTVNSMNQNGNAVMAFMYENNVPSSDTGRYDMGNVSASSGDNMMMQYYEGAFYFETHADTDILIGSASINTPYWCVMAYHANATHYEYVYNATTWTLVGSASTASTGNYLPAIFSIGVTGSDGETSGYYLYWWNVEIDYIGNGWLGP